MSDAAFISFRLSYATPPAHPNTNNPPVTQDMRGCLSPSEVCEGLGLPELRNRKWHVQSAIAIRGEGLYEGGGAV